MQATGVTAHASASGSRRSWLTHALGKNSEKNIKISRWPQNTGGFRKGAGRPKGSRNRATIAREAQEREELAAAQAENASLMPIDFLLQVLRDPMTPPGRRTEVAKFIAPYLEARMVRRRSNHNLGDRLDAAIAEHEAKQNARPGARTTTGQTGDVTKK